MLASIDLHSIILLPSINLALAMRNAFLRIKRLIVNDLAMICLVGKRNEQQDSDMVDANH